MIFNIIGTIIGALIFGSGIFYLIKEKEDKESRKIYSITSGIGVVIILIMVVKMILEMM